MWCSRSSCADWLGATRRPAVALAARASNVPALEGTLRVSTRRARPPARAMGFSLAAGPRQS